MEIEYTHSVHGTLRVGARLPFEGETIEEVIKKFAPVGYWVAKEKPVVVPEVGFSGTISLSLDSEFESTKENEVLL